MGQEVAHAWSKTKNIQLKIKYHRLVKKIKNLDVLKHFERCMNFTAIDLLLVLVGFTISRHQYNDTSYDSGTWFILYNLFHA